MKFISRKQLADHYDEYDYGALVKENKVKELGSIRLWHANANGVVENWQVEKDGFYICIELNEFGTCEDLNTDKLVEACQAYNTILQTMKA